jgi:hypothetical protein
LAFGLGGLQKNDGFDITRLGKYCKFRRIAARIAVFLVPCIFYPEGAHVKIFLPARPTQGFELTFYEAYL